MLCAVCLLWVGCLALPASGPHNGTCGHAAASAQHILVCRRAGAAHTQTQRVPARSWPPWACRRASAAHTHKERVLDRSWPPWACRRASAAHTHRERVLARPGPPWACRRASAAHIRKESVLARPGPPWACRRASAVQQKGCVVMRSVWQGTSQQVCLFLHSQLTVSKT